MKTLRFTIDLQCVEEGHSVELALHGLAAEHKYWRDIEKLIKKLADRNLEAVCSHQPLQVSRQHGEFRVQDSRGHNLFGRERKLHASSHKHRGKGDK